MLTPEFWTFKNPRNFSPMTIPLQRLKQFASVLLLLLLTGITSALAEINIEEGYIHKLTKS